MSTPVRIRKLQPGGDIDTYCGRCKDERAHQIVALNADGTPANVICRTCGGQHRFRAKRDSTTPARAAGRKVRGTAGAEREAPTGPARRYAPAEVYTQGELVDHPKFGIGKVTQARAGKIEVRFDSGNRILLHAG